MKLIEVVTSAENLKPVTSIAEQHDSEVNWVGSTDDQGRKLIRLLVGDEDRQSVLDALQGLLGETSKILVLSLEAVLPRKAPEPSDAETKEAVTTTGKNFITILPKVRIWTRPIFCWCFSPLSWWPSGCWKIMLP